MQCDPLFRHSLEPVRIIEPINLSGLPSPRCDQVGILKLDSNSVQLAVFINLLVNYFHSVAEMVASVDRPRRHGHDELECLNKAFFSLIACSAKLFARIDRLEERSVGLNSELRKQTNVATA